MKAQYNYKTRNRINYSRHLVDMFCTKLQQNYSCPSLDYKQIVNQSGTQSIVKHKTNKGLNFKIGHLEEDRNYLSPPPPPTCDHDISTLSANPVKQQFLLCDQRFESQQKYLKETVLYRDEECTAATVGGCRCPEEYICHQFSKSVSLSGNYSLKTHTTLKHIKIYYTY